MAKIYNIRSESLSEADLKEFANAMNQKRDVVFLNEEIYVNIFDTETCKSHTYKHSQYSAFEKLKINWLLLIDSIKGLFKKKERGNE